MKNFFIWLVLLVCIVSLNATIVDTKHNLSSTGTGAVKSTTEGEICVFCHIPHNARPGKPLWNRTMPSSAYTMYSSTYLERFNYPIPNDLGSANSEPGQLSRQCLSCHDGTVAIGSIYAVRGTVLGSALAVSNTNPDGTMKTSPALIGTNLTKHHPVGFEYDSAKTLTIGSSSKTIELKPTPDFPLKLYANSGKNYVECSSCHDPHKNNKKFLRVDTQGSHGGNIKKTCISCHDKDGWTGSAHDIQTNTYSNPNINTEYGTNRVDTLGCINCHTPHNGEGSEYLLRKVEQNTCFKGAGDSTSTSPCHGTGGAKDIESVLSGNAGHGWLIKNQDGVHTNLDYMYGTSVTRNPVGSKGIAWSDSKHIECMDCHNQHESKALPKRVAKNDWYPIGSNKSNLISKSGALTGASGVEPGSAARWTQPTSFSVLESATKEYQICLKCHSYWGLGTVSGGVSSFNLPSDASRNFTDQAWEFNKANYSGHPVVIGASSRTGGQGALVSNQMKSPWKTNLGTQTMYCSDCHGAKNESTSDPKGPHGSSNNFMLKGISKQWPADASGNLYIAGMGYPKGTGADYRTHNDLFCTNCHVIKVSSAKAHTADAAEMNGMYCVRCHSSIPHGTTNKRLIIYRNTAAPYNYNNLALITSYSSDSRDGVKARGQANGPNEPASNDKTCDDRH